MKKILFIISFIFILCYARAACIFNFPLTIDISASCGTLTLTNNNSVGFTTIGGQACSGPYVAGTADCIYTNENVTGCDRIEWHIYFPPGCSDHVFRLDGYTLLYDWGSYCGFNNQCGGNVTQWNVTTNQWFHFKITLDGTHENMYVDDMTTPILQGNCTSTTFSVGQLSIGNLGTGFGFPTGFGGYIYGVSGYDSLVDQSPTFTPTFTLTVTNTPTRTVTSTITITLTKTLEPTELPTRIYNIDSNTYYKKRWTPRSDVYGSTPNAYTHSFPQCACEAAGNVYIGGDFGWLNKVNLSNWMISHEVGIQNNRQQLVAGTGDGARVPDGTTDICWDGGHMLYTTSYWYNIIMSYNLNTKYFQAFSGNFLHAGDVQGNSYTAKYRFPGFVDVKGNTLYVTDRDSYIVLGIDTTTQVSHIVAGIPEIQGYVDGVGLTSTVELQGPWGIAVNSTNNLIYIADSPDIRVIDVAGNSVYTLCSVGYTIKGLTLSPDDKTLYTTLGHDVMMIDIASKTVSFLTNNGSGDNLYPEQKVTTINAKFSSPDNVRISPDGLRLYVTDHGNSKIRMINLDTTYVSNLHGFGFWGESNQANFTGWGEVYGFDFWGNTKIVCNTSASIVSKIYQDGIKEDIAGSPEIFNDIDGNSNTSRLSNVTNGKYYKYADTPTFWFWDMYKFKKLDLTCNVVTTIFGGTTGYAEGQGTSVEVGASSVYFSTIINNAIYFTDYTNNCVRKYDMATNTTSLVAGQPLAAAGNVDGVGLTTVVKFNGPCSITYDKNFNGNILYIMDVNNAKVCWIDLAGNSKGSIFSKGTTYGMDWNNNQQEHYYWEYTGSGPDKINKYKNGVSTTIGGSLPWVLYTNADGLALTEAVFPDNPRVMQYYDNFKYIVFNGLNEGVEYLDIGLDPTPTPVPLSPSQQGNFMQFMPQWIW